MTKVISVCNKKGGSGKSTVTTNLAYASCQDGQNVVIIDTDYTQGSSLDWYAKRNNNDGLLAVEAFDQESLKNIIFKAKEKSIDYVFIDTPGTDANIVNTAISLSDHCLIVTKTGGFDIKRSAETVETAKKLGIPTSFIINSAKNKQRYSQLQKLLSSLGHNVSDKYLSDLTAYIDASMFGMSVIELSGNDTEDKATFEVKQLYKWLQAKLSKNDLFEEIKGAAQQ